jgi:hypothetical protein
MLLSVHAIWSSASTASFRPHTHSLVSRPPFSSASIWGTTYLGDALDALRADGCDVIDEAAAHLTPAQHDHIDFYGTYSFDVETELQKDTGHSARRPPELPRDRRDQIRSAAKGSSPFNHSHGNVQLDMHWTFHLRIGHRV